MLKLLCRVEFHASHRLPGYEGDCARLHGHNWIAEAEVSGQKTDSNGLVVDFRTIKDALRRVVPDHDDLNAWMSDPPSTENIAREIYERLLLVGVTCSAVTVWETDRGAARYEPDAPKATP